LWVQYLALTAILQPCVAKKGSQPQAWKQYFAVTIKGIVMVDYSEWPGLKP